jgi:hypothetical protein
MKDYRLKLDAKSAMTGYILGWIMATVFFLVFKDLVA